MTIPVARFTAIPSTPNSLVAQRLNRMQARRAHRGREPEHDPDPDRDADRDEDGSRRDQDGETRLHLLHQPGDAPTEHDSEDAPEAGECDRLDEELREDV